MSKRHTIQHSKSQENLHATDSGLASLVDKHIGDRIRSFRQDRGVTQQELARALGISYQQVQKYENGANRVSAGRLYVIAIALGVDIGAFYKGLDGESHDRPTAITSEESIHLARELSGLKSPRVRSSIRSLIRSLTSDPDL